MPGPLKSASSFSLRAIASLAASRRPLGRIGEERAEARRRPEARPVARVVRAGAPFAGRDVALDAERLVDAARARRGGGEAQARERPFGSRSVSVLYWRYAAGYQPLAQDRCRRGRAATRGCCRRTRRSPNTCGAPRRPRRPPRARRRAAARASASRARDRAGGGRRARPRACSSCDEQAHEADVALRIARGGGHRGASAWRGAPRACRCRAVAIDLRPVDRAAEEDARDRGGEAHDRPCAAGSAARRTLRVRLAREVPEHELRADLGVDPLLDEVEQRGLVAPVGQLARASAPSRTGRRARTRSALSSRASARGRCARRAAARRRRCTARARRRAIGGRAARDRRLRRRCARHRGGRRSSRACPSRAELGAAGGRAGRRGVGGGGPPGAGGRGRAGPSDRRARVRALPRAAAGAKRELLRRRRPACCAAILGSRRRSRPRSRRGRRGGGRRRRAGLSLLGGRPGVAALDPSSAREPMRGPLRRLRLRLGLRHRRRLLVAAHHLRPEGPARTARRACARPIRSDRAA